MAARRARVPHVGRRAAPARSTRVASRATTGNLGLAVRYLRAKLYSSSRLVEAVSRRAVTGGDVPLDYFMGGLKSAA